MIFSILPPDILAQWPAETTPLDLPSAILSKGNSKLQPAVMKKITAEVKTGRFGEMASKNPAETGAMTPVLGISVSPSTRRASTTVMLCCA